MKASHLRFFAIACCLICLLLANSPSLSAQTFSATGSMTTARARHTATLLTNGMVLITGGTVDSSGSTHASAELYNPTTKIFTATGNMTAGRTHHTATLLNDGTVLIAGGYNGDGTHASAEIYNPTTGSFAATLQPMTTSRADHTATLLANGMVLIAGGYNGNGIHNSAELYNPVSQTFMSTGNMTVERELQTASLLSNGNVLIAGGENSTYLASAELYNPTAGTFTGTGNMHAARKFHTATLLNNRSVLVVGGYNGAYLTSAELYNVSAGSFALTTGSLAVAREEPTSTLLNDGNVLVAGGYNGAFLSSAELYNETSERFTTTGTMVAARQGSTATLLGTDDLVLVAGGFNSSYLSTAEVYNGPVPVTGFINPKYIVVGVTYAPPGSASSVTYTNTTSVGDTTTISSSFTNDVGFSVSVSTSVGIPDGKIVNGGYTLVATESTDYTQGSSSADTTTISKSSTIAYTTPGTPTFSPVNSDYDFIWLWVNPEILFYYFPAEKPVTLVSNGYAFDGSDPASGEPPPSGPYVAGPDVVEVQVGCLDGHFTCPSTLVLTNGVVTSGALARSWAAGEYTWPAGEGPGLTSADIAAILTFDPLVPSNDYTLLNSLPSTTTDGRFTKEPFPPNPVQYAVGAATEMFNTVQMDTQSVASGTTKMIKQAFGVSEAFGGGFAGLFDSTITLGQSDTLTWTYSYLNTLTTTTTMTDALTVKGPPDPPPAYSGPIQFTAYQDNIFGTFVFVPIPVN
jgi:deoxycytidylate deaminase